MRSTREEQNDTLPGELAAMNVPPRSRWQVLLVEYELLDAYWALLHNRVWMSGLVLIGLSMIGVTFLGVMLDAGKQETLRTIGLVGAVSSLLAVGWWLLLRRIFTAQRVAEYRRDEIERELGMRSGLYVTFLRHSRLFAARRASGLARELAEGDHVLEDDLKDFAASAEARPWLPRLMAERWVWLLVPWVMILAWAGLYLLKAGYLVF